MVQPERGDAATGDVITNTGDATVVIEDLALLEPDNVELLGSYLFPMDGNDDFVIGAGSTEPEDPWEQAAWETAQHPGTYDLASQAQASIAVAVGTITERTGTAKAIRVTCSLNGKQYTADTTTTIELSVTSCF